MNTLSPAPIFNRIIGLEPLASTCNHGSFSKFQIDSSINWTFFSLTWRQNFWLTIHPSTEHFVSPLKTDFLLTIHLSTEYFVCETDVMTVSVHLWLNILSVMLVRNKQECCKEKLTASLSHQFLARFNPLIRTVQPRQICLRYFHS